MLRGTRLLTTWKLVFKCGARSPTQALAARHSVMMSSLLAALQLSDGSASFVILEVPCSIPLLKTLNESMDVHLNGQVASTLYELLN